MTEPLIHKTFQLETIDPEKEIGIEVEVEGSRLRPRRLAYWNILEDGSLRGTSAEYVLKSPCKRSAIKSRIGVLKAALRKNEATVRDSDNCGVHIHINCQYMTTDQVFRFIILYFIVESLLINWCSPSRRGNLFCLRAQDAEEILSVLNQGMKHQSLSYCTQTDYRYAALNITSIAKFGSLEFRALETPQNFDKITKWAELLLRVKDASLSFDKPQDIVEAVSFKGVNSFLNFVFEEDAALLQCDNLEDVIYSGVRRVQDVAYSYEMRVPKKKRNTRKNIEDTFNIETMSAVTGNPRSTSDFFEPVLARAARRRGSPRPIAPPRPAVWPDPFVPSDWIHPRGEVLQSRPAGLINTIGLQEACSYLHNHGYTYLGGRNDADMGEQPE